MLNAQDARKQTELMKSIILSDTQKKYWPMVEYAILSAIERGESTCRIFNEEKGTEEIVRLCLSLGYQAHLVVGPLPHFYKPWILVSW